MTTYCDTRICKWCHEELPIMQFRMDHGHRAHTCKLCMKLPGIKDREAKRNRYIHSLICWPVK